MTLSFGARLAAEFAAGRHLCAGIDPHAPLLADWGLGDDAAGAERMGRDLVAAATGVVACVKPQIAFFERFGSAGLAALERVLSDARSAGLLVVADVKRGDIGSSFAAYADAWLAPGSPLEADAMTVAAYQGFGTLDGAFGHVRDHGKGLFVLAATNMPWDVDPALLRPGRFDRMVLVSPPDEPAREAILRLHLGQRPIEGIDLAKLVRATEGFSGADLKHLCDTAAEKALALSIKAGTVQPISMSEMNRALKEVKPSIGPWLDSARNVANYSNTDGRYDDLVDLLKRSKRL